MADDSPSTEGGGLVVGIDLGGTKALGVVLDPDRDGPPLVVDRVATPRGTEALSAAVVELGSALRTRAEADHGRPVRAIGLGAPGLVDRSGTLRFGANVPEVVDLDLRALLRAGVGVPAVVDNDATCAAWGEHERGAARGANHSITITLGTGIGAGVTVKGEPLRGAHGYAGEPGHMVVDPNGPLCPCGRRGCWERFGSGSGLGRLAREAAEAGRAGYILELAGGDPDLVRGEHVTRAALDGDDEARSVMRTFAWWVALGVANLVDLLDSELVVIGGGLVEAGAVLLDPIREAYAEQVYGTTHRPLVPIVQAELGEQAGAIGAALLAAART